MKKLKINKKHWLSHLKIWVNFVLRLHKLQRSQKSPQICKTVRNCKKLWFTTLSCEMRIINGISYLFLRQKPAIRFWVCYDSIVRRIWTQAQWFSQLKTFLLSSDSREDVKKKLALRTKTCFRLKEYQFRFQKACKSNFETLFHWSRRQRELCIAILWLSNKVVIVVTKCQTISSFDVDSSD